MVEFFNLKRDVLILDDAFKLFTSLLDEIIKNGIAPSSKKLNKEYKEFQHGTNLLIKKYSDEVIEQIPGWITYINNILNIIVKSKDLAYFLTKEVDILSRIEIYEEKTKNVFEAIRSVYNDVDQYSEKLEKRIEYRKNKGVAIEIKSDKVNKESGQAMSLISNIALPVGAATGGSLIIPLVIAFAGAAIAYKISDYQKQLSGEYKQHCERLGKLLEICGSINQCIDNVHKSMATLKAKVSVLNENTINFYNEGNGSERQDVKFDILRNDAEDCLGISENLTFIQEEVKLKLDKMDRIFCEKDSSISKGFKKLFSRS